MRAIVDAVRAYVAETYPENRIDYHHNNRWCKLLNNLCLVHSFVFFTKGNGRSVHLDFWVGTNRVALLSDAYPFHKEWDLNDPRWTEELDRYLLSQRDD